MLNIGFSELLVILLVALIVLGPEKLPELGRFLGRLSLEIKRGIEEVKSELGVDKIEEEIEEVKEEFNTLKKNIKDEKQNNK